MKTFLKFTALSAVLLMLAKTFTSCERGPYEFTVEGTWKLAHVQFYNGEGDFFIVELEPKDCDTCFVFTFVEVDFGNRVVMEGTSILNTIRIVETPVPYGHPHIEVTITDGDEPFDGNLFTEALRSATHIFYRSSRMYIAFAENADAHIQNLLVFNRINQ